MANLARHVAPGGVLAVEPWLEPERVDPGHIGLTVAEAGDVHVARMTSIAVQDGRSPMTFHYLVARPGTVERLVERHDLGLWTREEHAAAFARAGLEAACDEAGLMGRGLWLGTARAAPA